MSKESDNRPRELLHAARVHAETEGDNGNAEISFIAGHDYAVQRLEIRIEKLREGLVWIASDANIDERNLAKNTLKADDLEAAK